MFTMDRPQSKLFESREMRLLQTLFKKTCCLVALITLSSAFAPAQTSSQPAQAAPPTVRLNVIVTDEAGRPVTGLRREDFQVMENGVTQTISSFSSEALPLSYGLVIDTSGSLRSQIDHVIGVAQLIARKNKPEDETFLVRFVDSEKIEKVKEFTKDGTSIEKAMDGLYVEGGQSAIVDAVYESAKYVTEGKRGADASRRRALILFTDGEERNSFYKQEQLFALLRKLDVQIFVIGFVKAVKAERALNSAMKLLKGLAQETGGRAFFPKSPQELPLIADEIMNDLRTQYVIGFNSTDSTRGNERALRVTVADVPQSGKRVVYVRSGYIAPGKP